MKILQVNLTYKMGSTGKIMYDLNDVIEKNGHEGYMLCGYTQEQGTIPQMYAAHSKAIGLVIRKHLLESRITGRMGYSRKAETRRMIRWIQQIRPDIIHLHNIHGNWLNIFELMEYIRIEKIPLVWTLHDCWAFTGRCSHFEHCGCVQWINGCYKCKNKRVYPITYFFDRSRRMWIDKKNIFSAIDKMVLVTPSVWLSQYVKKSYFKNRKIYVINNGIDLTTFFPQKKRSQYYEKTKGKKVILGVASSWTEKKGLYDVYTLSKILEQNEYQIVLVGLNTKQLAKVPQGILGIGRTNNVAELAELYTEATVFINPTYQDNYPTVNLEAIACGTPVVTYHTGGSIESITEATGKVVPQGDIRGMADAVEEIAKKISSYRETCRAYAKKNFGKYEKYHQYMNIYEEILNEE